MAGSALRPGLHAHGCVRVSEPHLKTGNSEAAGVVRRRGHGDDEGAVGDVLVVESDRHLIVACRTTQRSESMKLVDGEQSVTHGKYL